jgi:hypothetical protein
MELSPLLIFWLLVAGAVVVTAVTHFRPQFRQRTIVWETAVALLAVTWLVWYLIGRQLPLTSSSSTSPLMVVWLLDELGWQLSGVWLLLVTAVVVASGQVGESASGQVGRLANLQLANLQLANLQLANLQLANLQLANLQLANLLLAAAGLIPLLAGNLAALLLAVTLLIGVWSAVLWLSEPFIREDATRLLPRAAWLMLSLLFVWLAAAFSPDLNSLAMAGWPRLAASSILVAALLLLGYWPFHGWRAMNWQLPAGMAALLHAAPALIGLALLARLVTGSNVGMGYSMGYSLFLTLFGLLGVFVGVRRAWSDRSPLALAGAVGLVQASLAGLALVWVGPEVAVGEARVLVLAVGLGFFIGQGLTRINTDFSFLTSLTRTGLFLALAGLSGLPLLAGFAGRAGLYGAWLRDGRFVLVLVAALLQMLLVTAVAASGQVTSGKLQVASDKAKLDSRHLLAAFLLLAGGLISFRGLAGVSIGVWLALLLPFGGGLALAYFVGEAEELNQVIRRAFVVDLPLDGVKRTVRAVGNWLETAVQDAVTIWEGEGGLLWLLALLIGLLVIGH